MKTAAKILILVIITILAATESLHCGPVRYREAIYVQPDGSTFNVKVRGDEWTKIRTTLDGCVISQDEMGWWCYGVYDSEGNLTCSEYHIGKKVPVSAYFQGHRIIHPAQPQKHTVRIDFADLLLCSPFFSAIEIVRSIVINLI